jgi:hypothetical protein
MELSTSGWILLSTTSHLLLTSFSIKSPKAKERANHPPGSQELPYHGQGRPLYLTDLFVLSAPIIDVEKYNGRRKKKSKVFRA